MYGDLGSVSPGSYSKNSRLCDTELGFEGKYDKQFQFFLEKTNRIV